VVPDNIVRGIGNELKTLFAALQGLGGPPGFCEFQIGAGLLQGIRHLVE